MDHSDEFRIYLDQSLEVYAVVDEEDYAYFSKWKWNAHKARGQNHSRRGTKVYARRSQGKGGAYKPPLYLHVEVHKRSGEVPPTLFHTIVDHEDGNELNCRRSNLRWATESENAKNRKRRKPNGKTVTHPPSSNSVDSGATIPF